MVMAMMVVMLARGKRRACDSQQQEGGDNKLLHAQKRSTICICTLELKRTGTKSATARIEEISAASWVNSLRNGV
jgi:hypothetical protein